MPTNQTPPVAAKRPKLWRYYRDRSLTAQQVGDAFGRTREWVRRVTLPFDDPRRQVPSPEDIARAFEWSAGEITPSDWYPPELSVAAQASPEPVAS